MGDREQQLDQAVLRYPEHLRPRIRAALKAGATVTRGKHYELGPSVFEIRWPNGAVEDLTTEQFGPAEISTPGAFRMAADFEQAMRDLVTAPGVSREEAQQIQARLVQLGSDIVLAAHPDLAELNVQLDGFYGA